MFNDKTTFLIGEDMVNYEGIVGDKETMIIFNSDSEQEMKAFLAHFGKLMTFKRSIYESSPLSTFQYEHFLILRDEPSPALKKAAAINERNKVHSENWCEGCYHVKEDCDC